MKTSKFNQVTCPTLHILDRSSLATMKMSNQCPIGLKNQAGTTFSLQQVACECPDERKDIAKTCHDIYIVV